MRLHVHCIDSAPLHVHGIDSAFLKGTVGRSGQIGTRGCTSWWWWILLLLWDTPASTAANSSLS